MESAKAEAVTLERRKASDRREGADRRKQNIPVAVERRQGERREKIQRRRQIDPTTCERDYSDAEVEFMRALDDYKRRSGRMFPTCSELLEVLRGLGYEKRVDYVAGNLASAGSESTGVSVPSLADNVSGGNLEEDQDLGERA